MDTGLAYATNPDNLMLDLADLAAPSPSDPLLETVAT
jgi:hypothetical protein